MLPRLTLALSLGLCVAAQDSRPESAPAPEPWLRARIADIEEFASRPESVAMLRIIEETFRESIGESDQQRVATLRTHFVELWHALRWPIEIVGCGNTKDGSFLLGIVLPRDTPSVLNKLLQLASTLIGPPRLPAIGRVRGGLATLSLPGQRVNVVEASFGDRPLLLVKSRELGLQAALERFAASHARVSPGTKRLQRTLKGDGFELVLNLSAALQAIGGEEAQQVLGTLKLFAGPRFAGIAMRTFLDGERFAYEAFADLAPGQGTIGGLFERQPSAHELLAWIPATSQEFTSVKVSIRGVVELLRTAGMFGVTLDPSQWGEGFAGWRRIDTAELLEEHLSGELLALTEPSTAANVANPDADEPTAFLLGSPDGLALLARLKELVAKLDPVLAALEPAKDRQGELVLAIGGEPVCRLAAQRSFLALALIDAGSQRLLDASLATGGRSGPPKSFTDRIPLPKDSAHPMVLTLGNLISDMAARIAIREQLTGERPRTQALPLLASKLEREFGGEKGRVATIVTVTESGLQVRSVR